MKTLLVLSLVIICFQVKAQPSLYDVRSANTTFIRPLCMDAEEIPGGYLVTGTGAGANRLCWVSRTDEQFNVLWTKSFEIAGDTTFMWLGNAIFNNNIILTDSGHFVLTVKSTLGSLHYTAILGMDLQNGAINWGKRFEDYFPGPWDTDLEYPQVFSNGDLLINRGCSAGTFMYRMHPSGAPVSSKMISNSLNDPGGADDMSWYTYICANQDLLVLQMHGKDMVVMRLTENFVPIWAKQFSHDVLTLIPRTGIELPDGELLITGSTMDSINSDICPLFTLSPDGDLLSYSSLSPNYSVTQIIPLDSTHYLMNSMGGSYAVFDRTTGISAVTNVSYLQANHGFQVKKTPNYFFLTGLGLDWESSQMGHYSSPELLECLLVTTCAVNSQARNVQDITVTDISSVIQNYTTPVNFSPPLLDVEVLFADQCYLSVEENEQPFRFSLSPNPASANVTISVASPAEGFSYVLTDMKGLVKESGSFSGETHQLNTALLAPGMYLVQLITADGKSVQVEKLIVE